MSEHLIELERELSALERPLSGMSPAEVRAEPDDTEFDIAVEAGRMLVETLDSRQMARSIKAPAWHPAAAEPEPAPRKRGRPSKGGVKGLHDLMRITLVVEAYSAARQAGQLHVEALGAACQAVKAAFPGARCSPSWAKAALAQWHSASVGEVLLVTRGAAPQSGNPSITFGPSHSIGFGPRPEYTDKREASARRDYGRRRDDV